jgi:hypothetical protein
MPKGVFPFLTIKDLIRRMETEFVKIGRKPPSRPTLYRLQERGVWEPTSTGANGWRKFNEEDLEKAAQAIMKDCEII